MADYLHLEGESFDASFLNKDLCYQWHGLPLRRREILQDPSISRDTLEEKRSVLWALGLIWASVVWKTKQNKKQSPCLPPAGLVKAGISHTLHSVPFGDNFSFIKADIIALPPTHSAVIMKVMFPGNGLCCC